MHISEGVLSAPVLIAGGALTVAGSAIGLKKLDYDRLAQVGILSAAFFLASLMLTEESFLEVAALVVTAHLPVMIIEGIITAFCVVFLKKVQPETISSFAAQK